MNIQIAKERQPGGPHFLPAAVSPGAGQADHELTVIIPAFNEEKRLPWTLQEIGIFLDQWGVDYRVVVADDGSADRTSELTRPLGKRFLTVRLAQHAGKGRAVRAAMLQATGRVVAFTDADLPFELAALREGYEWIHQRTCEVVFGARDIAGAKHIAARRLSRRIATAGFREIVKHLISREVTDTQCGLKLFGRRAAREIFSRATIDGFAFDAEVVFLTRRLRLPFRRLPVSLIHDYDSTLSLRRHALPMLWDVVWLRLREWLGGRRVAAIDLSRQEELAPREAAPTEKDQKTGGVMNAARTGLTASDSRRLVLHADDLGMSRLVSEGIFHGFRAGPLTSASLLSNGPDAVGALQRWGELCRDQLSGGLPSSPLRQRLDDRGRPFDLGVHLNLTEGRPLEAAAYPAELLDEEGCFPGVSTLFGRLRRGGGRFREALAGELSRQVQFLLDHGARPTHLNGHQYIELLPGVRELIPPLMEKFAIRVVRAAREPSTWRLLLGRGKGVLGKVRAAAQQYYAGQFRRAMDRRGFRHADAFFGTALAGQIDMRWMRRFLAGRFRLAEICLHPGLAGDAEDGDWSDPLAALRPRELEMLVSADFADYLVTRGIRLGRLAELAGA